MQEHIKAFLITFNCVTLIICSGILWRKYYFQGILWRKYYFQATRFKCVTLMLTAPAWYFTFIEFSRDKSFWQIFKYHRFDLWVNVWKVYCGHITTSYTNLLRLWISRSGIATNYFSKLDLSWVATWVKQTMFAKSVNLWRNMITLWIFSLWISIVAAQN